MVPPSLETQQRATDCGADGDADGGGGGGGGGGEMEIGLRRQFSLLKLFPLSYLKKEKYVK